MGLNRIQSYTKCYAFRSWWLRWRDQQYTLFIRGPWFPQRQRWPCLGTTDCLPLELCLWATHLQDCNQAFNHISSCLGSGMYQPRGLLPTHPAPPLHLRTQRGREGGKRWEGEQRRKRRRRRREERRGERGCVALFTGIQCRDGCVWDPWII